MLRAPKAGAPGRGGGAIRRSRRSDRSGRELATSFYWGAMAWGGDVPPDRSANGSHRRPFRSARVTTLRVIGDSLWFSSVAENSDANQGPLGRVPLDGGPTTLLDSPDLGVFRGRRPGPCVSGSIPILLGVETAFESPRPARRVDIGHGAPQELVANVPSLDGGGVAVTREWLFVNQPRRRNELGGSFPGYSRPQP